MILAAALALLAPVTGAVPTQAAAPAEQQTVIRYAANGGIREIEPGPRGSNIAYLRDRTDRWHKVTLTGPCLSRRSLDTVTFTTDALGTFDRFSSVRSLREPYAACGVTSIVQSGTPAARGGKRPD